MAGQADKTIPFLSRILFEMLQTKLCPRALVVDDDHDTAEAFAALIQSLGCEAVVVTDPLRAVETADCVKPEVVFLDIGMPGLNGNELARALRAKYGWALRIVAVTAHADEEHRLRSREAGFDAYMVKPVDVTLIESTLHTLFPQLRWR